MKSGGQGADPVSALVGVGGDILGGAISGLFGQDQPQAGYNKQYGTEGRILNYGSKIGQRMAMGDPSVAAYYNSKMQSDPEWLKGFFDEFGGDLRQPGTTASTSAQPVATGFSSATPGIAPMGPRTNQSLQQVQDASKQPAATNTGNTQDVMNQILSRLSHTASGTEQVNNGYSGAVPTGFGNPSPSTIGGFNASNGQPMTLDNVNARPAGSGNRYAKLNQERQSGSMF